VRTLAAAGPQIVACTHKPVKRKLTFWHVPHIQWPFDASADQTDAGNSWESEGCIATQTDSSAERVANQER
jgi:hypothetical protein